MYSQDGLEVLQATRISDVEKLSSIDYKRLVMYPQDGRKKSSSALTAAST